MVTKTATTLREDKERPAVETSRCQHHWLIDPPEGRTSDGECLLCRARKTFPNYLSDCLIENDREKFEEWLARQGRKKAKAKGSWDILSEIEEGM
ncbi:MAG: hypothetical protein QUS33_03280 [Dehalococcoidia bacterium]|nr:hypothetical protein [Dehalococcoidia bacterium]